MKDRFTRLRLALLVAAVLCMPSTVHAAEDLFTPAELSVDDAAALAPGAQPQELSEPAELVTDDAFSDMVLEEFAQVPAAPTDVHVTAGITTGVTCDQTLSSGANIATALSSITAGSTICLNNGSYSYNATVSKSSMTTVTIAPGATQAGVTLTLNTNASNNLRFDGMTLPNGFQVGNGSVTATNIQITNVNVQDGSCIANPGNSAQHILIDHAVFNNVAPGCNEGRLGIYGVNTTHTIDQDITVSNSTFSGSGGGGGAGSDGIQITGGARGILITQNTFTGILEGGCGAAHCDAIQAYGGDNISVTKNYFYNNSTLFVIFDCNATVALIQDNIFYQEPGSAANAVYLSGQSGGTLINHNTFGANTDLSLLGGNESCGNSSVTIKDNVIADLNPTVCTSCTVTNNTTSGFTFVGGSTPSTASGFALVSPTGTASDGGNTGTRYFGPYGP